MSHSNSRSPLTLIMIVVCLIGLTVSLIPEPVYTDPFWGVSGFADKDLFAPDLPGIRILKIEPGSPASLAGIKQHDRILQMNGKEVQMSTFRHELKELRPGDALQINGIRGETAFESATAIPEPIFEALVVYDWQFAAASIFTMLGLLLIATQPINPPLWCSLATIIGGLAVCTTIIVIEMLSLIPFTPIVKSRVISNGPAALSHYSIFCAAFMSGLSLAFLGALACRAWLVARQTDASATKTPTT